MIRAEAQRGNASHSQLLVLGVILTMFALLKTVFTPYPIGYLSDDGSYYYQLAQHVAAGHGLVTSVSLYHQGLSPLPHPAPIYPLWPLLLGGVGAVIGLHTAAVWLPPLFYLVSLVLLYRLAVVIASRFGDPTLVRWRERPLLDVGHVVVVLFASNPIFFRYTSLPFTEGLGFTIAFAVPLACQKCADTQSTTWGFIAGLLGGLSFLTRSQFLGFALAPSLCLGVLSIAQPSLRRAFVAATVSAGALVLALVWYLVATFRQFVPQMVLDVVAYREDLRLGPYEWLVDRGSLRRNLLDWVKGIYVAFHPTHLFSYAKSFGWLIYLIPIAVVAIFVRPRVIKAAVAAALQPRTLVVTVTLVAGLASVVPTHTMHVMAYDGWYFGARQGLPLVFILLVAVAFMVCSGSLPMRLVVATFIAISLWQSQEKLQSLISRQSPMQRPPNEAQIALREWIGHQPSSSLFMGAQANPLAAATGGNFHFASCFEKPDQMVVFLRELKITYLVTTPPDRQCDAFKAIAKHLEPAMSFGSGRDEIVLWRYVD